MITGLISIILLLSVTTDSQRPRQRPAYNTCWEIESDPPCNEPYYANDLGCHYDDSDTSCMCRIVDDNINVIYLADITTSATPSQSNFLNLTHLIQDVTNSTLIISPTTTVHNQIILYDENQYVQTPNINADTINIDGYPRTQLNDLPAAISRAIQTFNTLDVKRRVLVIFNGQMQADYPNDSDGVCPVKATLDNEGVTVLVVSYTIFEPEPARNLSCLVDTIDAYNSIPYSAILGAPLWSWGGFPIEAKLSWDLCETARSPILFPTSFPTDNPTNSTTHAPTTKAPSSPPPRPTTCADTFADTWNTHIWFEVTVPAGIGSIIFHTCFVFTSLDTQLDLYDAAQTQLIGSADDGCNDGSGKSKLQLDGINSKNATIYMLKLSSNDLDVDGTWKLHILCIAAPTYHPTQTPTNEPTFLPTMQTNNPTPNPTPKPTKSPTNNPSKYPTILPTDLPTNDPTKLPTQQPTKLPTYQPTKLPTHIYQPTQSPIHYPTQSPTVPLPTWRPTAAPQSIVIPSVSPTENPTIEPTDDPPPIPSVLPTTNPTRIPSVFPTKIPTVFPTVIPSDVDNECLNNETNWRIKYKHSFVVEKKKKKNRKKGWWSKHSGSDDDDSNEKNNDSNNKSNDNSDDSNNKSNAENNSNDKNNDSNNNSNGKQNDSNNKSNGSKDKNNDSNNKNSNESERKASTDSNNNHDNTNKLATCLVYDLIITADNNNCYGDASSITFFMINLPPECDGDIPLQQIEDIFYYNSPNNFDIVYDDITQKIGFGKKYDADSGDGPPTVPSVHEFTLCFERSIVTAFGMVDTTYFIEGDNNYYSTDGNTHIADICKLIHDEDSGSSDGYGWSKTGNDKNKNSKNVGDVWSKSSDKSFECKMDETNWNLKYKHSYISRRKQSPDSHRKKKGWWYKTRNTKSKRRRMGYTHKFSAKEEEFYEDAEDINEAVDGYDYEEPDLLSSCFVYEIECSSVHSKCFGSAAKMLSFGINMPYKCGDVSIPEINHAFYWSEPDHFDVVYDVNSHGLAFGLSYNSGNELNFDESREFVLCFERNELNAYDMLPSTWKVEGENKYYSVDGTVYVPDICQLRK